VLVNRRTGQPAARLDPTQLAGEGPVN
jgi:hypothetical protein